MDSVERNYSDALLAALEENGESLQQAKEEIRAVQTAVSQADGFVKLMNAPTVSFEEKLSVIREAFEGKVSRTMFNFLCVLTEGKRWSEFAQICRRFCSLCNEKLGVAEITVTSAFPLTAEQREKIRGKMSEIIGKEIIMTEKTDKSIMGGIIADYGDTRLDGSVKTKLENLRDRLLEVDS